MRVASGDLDGSLTGNNSMFSHSAYPGLEGKITFYGGVEDRARYSDLDDVDDEPISVQRAGQRKSGNRTADQRGFPFRLPLVLGPDCSSI